MNTGILCVSLDLPLAITYARTVSASAQLSALADPTRRTIFELVAERPASVGSLADRLPVSRPAVSQHLRVLAEADLVESSRQGTRRIYSVRTEGLTSLHTWLDRMWETALDRFEKRADEENRMTTEETTVLAPVVKTRQLPISPETAFRLFTEEIATWWPLDEYSIGADKGQVPTSVRLEPAVGGRIVEVGSDGSETSWADVIVWQPPHRLVLAWHPSLEPTVSTILEVRFSASDDGTELHLEHRGWEEFGDQAPTVRRGYEGGWDKVLAGLERAAGG
jgi:DNA-binding transcriptional ArsR family regulator